MHSMSLISLHDQTQHWRQRIMYANKFELMTTCLPSHVHPGSAELINLSKCVVDKIAKIKRSPIMGVERAQLYDFLCACGGDCLSSGAFFVFNPYSTATAAFEDYTLFDWVEKREGLEPYCNRTMFSYVMCSHIAYNMGHTKWCSVVSGDTRPQRDRVC